MITFFNKTICKRTTPGQRQSVQNEEYYVHVFMRSDGLCATATCDSEYPPRVAFSLLGKIAEDFDAAIPTWKTEVRNEAIVWPALETMLAKYQDPASADQIMKIQKNLDETRDVLHQTIDRYDIMNTMEQYNCIYLHSFINYAHQSILLWYVYSVLQRGEKLEDLVERSGELSAQSKLFYKQAKRANSCCVVI